MLSEQTLTVHCPIMLSVDVPPLFAQAEVLVALPAVFLIEMSRGITAKQTHFVDFGGSSIKTVYCTWIFRGPSDIFSLSDDTCDLSWSMHSGQRRPK